MMEEALMQSSKAMQRAKLACDACHRRKVKCNGLQKCQQCTHLGLECRYDRSYTNLKSRDGNKRGCVIDSLKAKRQQQSQRAIAVLPAKAVSAVPSPSLQLGDQSSSSYLTGSFFKDLAQDYETFVFAFIPIISKEEFLQITSKIQDEREVSALAYALTAMTLNMRSCPEQGYDSVRSEVMKFTTRALEIRGPIMPHYRLSTRTIMISTIVSACLLAHHADHEITTFYLREAITCMEILRSRSIEEREPIQLLSRNGDMNQRERLYWLLFVHERFAAISLFRRPILPTPTDPLIPDLENHGGVLPSGVYHWFISIIRLFCVLDDTFLDTWIDKNSPREVDFGWIQAKQAHLSQVMDLAQQQSHDLTDMQQVDLTATALWLRTLLWRIALSKLLLTSDASADSMSLFFPLHLSRQLQGLLISIPRTAFEVHGTGMLEKIFDVTNTLADILISVPVLTSRADFVGHISQFVFFRNYLYAMSRFGEAERKILQDKCDDFYRVCAQGQPQLDLQYLQDLLRFPV